MARSDRRREQHRTSISAIGGRERAEIIIPIESIEWERRAQLRLDDFTPWFRAVASVPTDELAVAPTNASVVLDRFSFTLHLTTNNNGCEVTGTHDGDRFLALANGSGVDVYLTADLDVRRAKPPDFAATAAAGKALGARVDAYGVDTLA